MTINALFYKGPEGFFGKAIRLWTHSPYSHVELEFCTDPNRAGERFASRPGSGVSWARPLFLEQEKFWDRVNIKITDEAKVKAWCMMQWGDKYDWPGIFFSQIIPLKRRAYSKWFCSELATAAVQQDGFWPGILPQAISPGRFSDLLKP